MDHKSIQVLYHRLNSNFYLIHFLLFNLILSENLTLILLPHRHIITIVVHIATDLATPVNNLRYIIFPLTHLAPLIRLIVHIHLLDINHSLLILNDFPSFEQPTIFSLDIKYLI